MQELAKIIEDFIKEISSEDTLKVFKLLWGKSNISEFDLAEELKLSINYVRNLLYGLHAHNLVTSTRKKDRQKGWYIYYWTFNLKHAIDLLLIKKRNKVNELKKLLEEREETYYVCPDKHIRVDSVDAIELGFKCTECEQLLKSESSKQNEEEVGKEIERLGKEIEILERPIELPKVEVEEKPKRKRVSKKKVVKKKSNKVIKKKIIKKKLSKIKNKKPLKKIIKKKINKVIKKKPFKQSSKKHPVKKKKRKNVNMNVSLAGAVEGHQEVKHENEEDSSAGILDKIKNIRKRVGF